MATLRTTPNFRAPTITQQELDTLRVSGMNSLTRGYEAGRMGTEANSALAEEATLRAEGRLDEADVLAGQIRGLRLRQGTIGPRVQRVEQIDGLSDAGSWAAGMVGQGVASMQDPVAAGTLAAGAGTALSFVPNPVAQAVGRGLRTVGAFAAPYAINQEQLKGEFYGQAKDDPEIMSRYNAQQLNTAANAYGAAAGALDSVVPGIIGRGLGGAGLRAGLAATGPMTRTALSMAGEGVTETGQGELSRAVRSTMNPNRDTSGDMLERINEFAGGAVGAGPFAAGGAYADAGYRRVGAVADGTADFVKEKAGRVVDLYDGSVVQRGVDGVANKAKDLFSRGKEEVVDLATGEDGKISARELAKNLRDKTQEGVDYLRQKQEERDILLGMPPEDMDLDGPEFATWFNENETKRAELVSTRLTEMADKGDERAMDLLRRGFGEGVAPEEQMRAMDEASQLILETSNLEAFIKQAERGGGMAAKGADIAGRIARRAAEGIGTLGKAAWDGFKSGGKKNLQTISDQEMEASRNPQTGEVLKGGRGDQFDADAAYNRNVLEDGYALAEKKRDSLRRAQLMGEYLAKATKDEASRYKSVSADVNVDNLASFMGDMGAEIADIAESWSSITSKRPSAIQSQRDTWANDARLNKRSENRGNEDRGGPQSLLKTPNVAGQFDNLKLNLNRIANSLNNAFAGAAKEKVGELRTMAGPEAAPFFDFLEAEIDTVQSKRGAQETAKTRREAQDAVVSAIDPDTRIKLIKQGINLNTPAGKRQLLGMAEAIASGRVAPGFDKALADVIGRDNLDAILDTVAPIPVEEEYLNDAEVTTNDTGLEMDDDGEMREAVASTNAVEKNDAERLLAKGTGGKIYGFYDLRGLRGDVGIKDPFRPAAKQTKEQALNDEAVSRERAAEGLGAGAGKRPRLIPLDKEGADAGARARVEKALKVDRTPERMLALLKQEAADSTNSRSTDASRAGPNRAVRAVAAVEKAMAQAKAGDIKSQEWLNDRMEAFFLNRAGAWRVETKTAASVLRDMNAQPARIIALYRDYLRDDALRIAKSQPERAAELGQLASQANRMVMDLMDKSEKKGALRLTPRQRRAIMDDARYYFESRGLVVAERISNQDPAEIAPDIVLDMHKEGTKAADQVRGKKRDVKDVNMLVFKSDLTDGKELYVPVGKLVRLVRERRAMSEPVNFEANQESQSNQAKNQRYARDVMEGIAMLVGGGHVDGLPTMFGTGQTFEKGLPDSLRLATSTVSDMKFAANQRRKAAGPPKQLSPEQEAKRAAAYQEAVARDQARGEDPFTPEDRTERDPAGGYSPTSTRQRAAAEKLMANLIAKWGDDSKSLLAEYNAKAPNATSSEQFTKRLMLTGTTNETATRDGDPVVRHSNIRTDRTGTVDPGPKSTDPKYAKQLERMRVDPDRATQLDVTDGQQGTVMDDFTEQRMRSVSQGYDAGATQSRAYPKGRMGDQGEFRGRELASLMGSDIDAGMADAKLWLRMAKSPAYDAKGTTGGAHLAMPVAYALNPERMAGYDLGPAQAKEAQAMRVEVVRIVKDSSMRPADKLKILKQVAAPEHVAKLNAVNMRVYMENVAKRDATVDLGGSKAAPKTRAQIDAESTKAVEAFQAKQASAKEAEAPVGKSQPPAGGRKLNAQSVQIHNELGRSGFAATHDSPIRHEGKFDWRAHQGKGEGNASFGAGTYLSTANGVHKNYKAQFTKELPGARSFEWAGRLFEYDPDGGEIYIDGMPAKTGSAEYEVAHAMLAYGMLPDDALQYARENAYSVVDRSGADIADIIDVSEPNVPSKDLAYVLSALRNRRQMDADKIHPALKPFLSVERWNRMVVAGDRRAETLKEVDISALRTPLNAVSPTYQVSVDIAPDRLMDWDKPVSEQSLFVRNALSAMLDDTSIPPAMSGVNVIRFQRDMGASDFPSYPARRYYTALTASLGSQAKASDYLQSLGILGHKYAAAGGRNDTHPNYVIYDDSKITTNYVHFNAQDRRNATGQRATPEQIQQAKDYVQKVLGPKIKVDFQDITGYSGEWIDATETIVISTTAAAGTMQTTYHEALHAFFGRMVKNEPRVFEVLKSLAEDQKIGERVLALLDGYPAAQRQYLTSGEERLAYIFQFWAAGELDLPGKPQNLLQKLVRFFRQVLGRITDSERATAIFEAFHEGALADPSAAGQILAKKVSEGTLTTRQLRKVDAAVQKLRSFVLPAQSILGNSDSAAARKLAQDFWTNPGEEEDGGDVGEGYINAREAMSRRYNNMLGDVVRGLSDRDMKDVARLLQQRADPATIAYTPHREAVKNIRKLLQRFYRYMTDERGVELGHLGDDYYPRTWSPYELGSKQEQFIQMLLTKYDSKMQEAVVVSGGKVTKEQVARRIFAAIFSNQVVADHKMPNRDDGVLTPFFASKNNRVLSWIADEDAEPFLNKDLIGTLSQYFHNGARAAEYTARFGQHGEQLDTTLAEIMGELAEAGEQRMRKGEFKDTKARDLWVQRQYEQVTKAVGAMEGTLGNDIGSTWRETNTWVTVYQNVRLLPLALFASVVDPLGMVARGAPFREAYDTFLRGIKEVGATWGDLFRDKPKERAIDQWEKLALAVGSVDAAMFSHHVADEYASVYMSKRAKKINDKFFQINGMEAWNRGMRIGATKSAALFIARHSKLPDAHSARWLKELGLTQADITLDSNGDLIADKNVLMAAKGITKQQAEQEIDKIHYAINRWVQGAILTPNAAQRPAWSSDPHYSMFFHLKQFSYSFHQTVLKRAVNEMGHGNLGPMGAFIWYIPMMIASDLTKGLLQGGGELPAHMKGMDAGDWIMRGAERAGLLGIGQIGVDAGQDIWSVGGPAVEQIVDGFTQPLNETTLRALPANAVYAEAFK